MKDKDNKETDLILKQLKNTASEDEKYQFSEWLKLSSENKNTFDEMSKLWKVVEDPAGKFDPDIEFSWENVRLKANIEEREKISKARLGKLMTSSFLVKIAASFILLLGIGWFLKIKFFSSEMMALKTGEKQKLFILPDGSKILLNKNSSIFFIKGFDNSQREIELEGEAFCEIKKDALHPFSIKGRNAKITVLGTSFKVLMDKLNNKTEVEVLTGKVLLEDIHSGNYKILTSGYKASLLSNGDIVKGEVADTSALTRRDHHFSFRNTKLSEVAESLQKHFEVTIEFQNSKIKNCRYTGSFDKASINEIIETIAVSMDLSYEEKKGKYILKGEACP